MEPGIAGKWPCRGGLSKGWVVDQMMLQRHRGIAAGRVGTTQEFGTF